MERFIALLASGLTTGAAFALLALGIVILQNATGVINFGQGDFMTLGAYIGFWILVQHHMSEILMYSLVLVAMFVVGLAVERVGYAPLRRRSHLTIVISTFALGLAVRAAIIIWQGTDTRNLPSPFGSASVDVFGARIPRQYLLAFGVTLVVGIGLYVLFQRTAVGRQVRALAADRETAILQGVRVNRLTPIVFGVSTALAGVAGILIGPTVAVTPTLGYGMLLSAFGAVVLGGERLGGVAFSAIFIAVFQVMATGYLSPNYSDAYPYLVLVVVLAVRPQGLVKAVSGVRY